MENFKRIKRKKPIIERSDCDMKKIKLSGKIALDYLTKYPDMPSRTLAILMLKEQPRIYANLNTSRNAIRYYRGAMGVKKFKAVTVRDFVVPPAKDKQVDANNPFGLPKSQERKFEPYVIGVGLKKALVLPDIHLPYHNMKALTLALEVGKNENVDCVILNGDTLDCYALSDYEKDPRERAFKDEIKDCKRFFKVLRKLFPSAKIIFKEGNHEYRFERLLLNKAPEFLGVNEFQLKVLLGCYDFGIDYVAEKRYLQMGYLNILHGDEYKGFSAMYPASAMGRKAKVCTLSSHNHRSDKSTSRSLVDVITSNWTTGCLCELHPKYMPYNNWNHGFSVVYRDGDSFEVRNKSIIGGRVYEG